MSVSTDIRDSGGPWSTRSSSVHDDDLDIDYNDKESLLPSLGSRPSRKRRSALAWLRSRPRLLWRAVRRQPRSALKLLLRYAIYLIIFVFTATPIVLPSYTRHPKHYRDMRDRCFATDSPVGCANPHNEKVFISVSLYDPHGTIVGGEWASNMLDLIRMIGHDNVFLSIYENDSGEPGAKALNAFEKTVPCKHKFVNEAHVAYNDFPHITMPDGSQRLKRLAYLSEMRNRALYPLDRFTPEDGIVQFDKVLFLNDAIFAPIDAAHLLFSTNTGADGRTHYLSACALDYDRSPFLLYDVYAQRDSQGFSNGVPLFPYFSQAGSGESRSKMLSQTDAVPAKSCWAGMVAMQARHVQNLNSTLPSKDWQAIGHHVIDPDHPRNVTAPVRFRYEPELYMDACECCLFLADVSTVAENAGEPDTGVFVNPYVRVSYRPSTLRIERIVRRWERLFSLPQGLISTAARLPTPNPHRLVEEGMPFEEEIYAHGWRTVQRTGRNGMFCGVREMQLILEGPRNGRNYEDYRDIPWQEQKLHFPP